VHHLTLDYNSHCTQPWERFPHVHTVTFEKYNNALTELDRFPALHTVRLLYLSDDYMAMLYSLEQCLRPRHLRHLHLQFRDRAASLLPTGGCPRALETLTVTTNTRVEGLRGFLEGCDGLRRLEIREGEMQNMTGCLASRTALPHPSVEELVYRGHTLDSWRSPDLQIRWLRGLEGVFPNLRGVHLGIENGYSLWVPMALKGMHDLWRDTLVDRYTVQRYSGERGEQRIEGQRDGQGFQVTVYDLQGVKGESKWQAFCR
jgi:hypothetical protein